MSTHRGFPGLDRRRRRSDRVKRRLSFEGAAVVCLAVGVAALAFAYVAQTTALRDLTGKVTGARAILSETEDINQTLQFRIDQALSLERVSRIAREQLGMVEPEVIYHVRFHP